MLEAGDSDFKNDLNNALQIFNQMDSGENLPSTKKDLLKQKTDRFPKKRKLDADKHSVPKEDDVKVKEYKAELATTSKLMYIPLVKLNSDANKQTVPKEDDVKVEEYKAFGMIYLGLVSEDLNKTLHSLDNIETPYKIPKSIYDYIAKNRIDMNSLKGQLQVPECYKQSGKSCGNERTGGSFSGLVSPVMGNISNHFQSTHGIGSLQFKQYSSYIKPGGIELCEPLLVTFPDFLPGNLEKQHAGQTRVDSSRACLLVQTQRGTLEYWPPNVSRSEIQCIEAAVTRTTKAGLMFSLELEYHKYQEYHEHDGIDEGHEGAELVIKTLTEADRLLGDLSFGVDITTDLKTLSVASYQNPLDVRVKLLEECLEKIKSGEHTKTFDIYSKFANVIPHPTFKMNRSARAHVKENKIILFLDAIICIEVRGIYIDWLNNIYYEEKEQCCLDLEPFLKDFVVNNRSYINKYPVLAKLEQYAIIVGLLRNNELVNTTKTKIYSSIVGLLGKIGLVNTTKTKTYKRFLAENNSKCDIHESELINGIEAAKRTRIKGLHTLESIIQFEQNPIIQNLMMLNIAKQYIRNDQFGLKSAKDVIIYALHRDLKSFQNNNFDPKDSEILYRKYIADALCVLSQIIHKEIITWKFKLFFFQIIRHGNYSSTDKFFDNDDLIDIVNILIAKEKQIDLSDLENSDYKETLLAIQSIALNISLQFSIEVGCWMTAAECCEMIAASFEETSSYESNVEFVADSLKQLANTLGIAKLVNDLCPSGLLDGDNGILDTFSNLLNSQSLDQYDLNNLKLLSGFVYFGFSGSTMDKEDFTSLYSALWASLTSIRCFLELPKSILIEKLNSLNISRLAAAAAERAYRICLSMFQKQQKEKMDTTIEEIKNELRLFYFDKTKVDIDNLLKNINIIYEKCKREKNGKDLVFLNEILLNIYESLGQHETASIWKRRLEYDKTEFSIK